MKEVNTLMKRMGFADKELTTPEHDKLMMALTQNNNYYAEYLFRRRYSVINIDGKNVMDCDSFGEKIKIFFEVPVLSDNKYVIGVVDAIAIIGVVALLIEAKPKVTSFGETMRQLNIYGEFISNLRNKFQFNYISTVIISLEDSEFKDMFKKQGILFDNVNSPVPITTKAIISENRDTIVKGRTLGISLSSLSKAGVRISLEAEKLANEYHLSEKELVDIGKTFVTETDVKTICSKKV